LTCPGVRQAAAIAIPDETWGERPLLAVVRASGAGLKAEDVIGHLSDMMAKWQLPDKVLFMDELPMTATGKISKLALREQLAKHPGDLSGTS